MERGETGTGLVAVWADRAPLVIAAIAFLALCTAAYQLIFLRRRAREDRTYEYFRRYVDWEFAKHTSAAASFARYWRTPKGLKLSEKDEIMLVANFFDELGAHFVRGRLDAGLVDTHFWELSEGYFGLFEPFVRDTQERVPGAFREWEEMNRRLKARRNVPTNGMELISRTLPTGVRNRLDSASLPEAVEEADR